MGEERDKEQIISKHLGNDAILLFPSWFSFNLPICKMFPPFIQFHTDESPKVILNSFCMLQGILSISSIFTGQIISGSNVFILSQ